MANNVLASLLLNIVAKSDVSGLNNTTKSLKNMGAQANKTSSLLKAMSTKLFGGFNVNTLLDAGKKYLQFEKDAGAIQSRFYAITGDQKRAVEEFDYIRKVATDTAQDIKSTADSYSIFYAAAAKSMGGDGARQIFKDWTEVSRVLHLTPYQFERVTYALREMTSKGAIYSQDLRMQIGTHVPNAMGLAQKAVEDLGITGSDWFEKFQKQAKGNQPLINEFVKNFSKYARMQFATPEALKNALRQPDALANSIKNIGTNFMFEFSRKGGNEMIVNVLENIKDALLKIDYVKLAEVLGSIAKGVGKIFELLPQILFILKNIAMSVAIWAITKGAIGAYRGIRGGYLALQNNKLRTWLTAGLGRSVTKGVMKGTIGSVTKIGLKSLIPKLIGFIGGPWVGFLMLLPELVSLVRWIWGKFSKDKPNTELSNWSNWLSTMGVSQSNTLATLKKLQDIYNASGRTMSLQDLRTRAGYYLGDKATKDIVIDDKGQIILNFNGSFLTYSEIEDMIKKGAEQKVKSEKQGIWGNLFNKPVRSATQPQALQELGLK